MTEVAQPVGSEPKDVSCAEDPVIGEVTEQEREEKPYDVTTDDETRVRSREYPKSLRKVVSQRHRDVDSSFQIEEENVPEEEHPEVTESPFVEEPEGAESKPQTGPMATEDAVQIEEVTSGGEEFEWGDQDA